MKRKYKSFILFSFILILLYFLHIQDVGKPSSSDSFTCDITPTLQTRYRALRPQKYLLAIALHQSEPILKNMMEQLLVVIEVLKPENVFVSIYEGGSTDASSEFLEEFKTILDQESILNSILTKEEIVDWSRVHRISKMAEIRNKVLQPLYDSIHLYHTAKTKKFDRVLFLNDVVFCAADILELLLQHEKQSSDFTCPLDFMNLYHHMSFYDVWVGRTMVLYND
jgi:alpha-1,3-mannosyltransferase